MNGRYLNFFAISISSSQLSHWRLVLAAFANSKSATDASFATWSLDFHEKTTHLRQEYFSSTTYRPPIKKKEGRSRLLRLQTAWMEI